MFENIFVLVMWWGGTLACLVKGIFALLSPTGWLSKCPAVLPSLKTRPKAVRIVGAIALIVGVFWTIQAFQMTLKFLHEQTL